MPACFRAEGEKAGMLAKRTSHYLAPSLEHLASAQDPAPRGERHSLQVASEASRDPCCRSRRASWRRRTSDRLSDYGASSRGGSGRRRSGILADRVTTWFRNFHPGESRGTSRPEIANHRTVVRGWDGPNRPAPPAGPGATIGPTPAIMSASGPIDPPAVRLARKSMIARPGAGFAGKVQGVGGWGWPRPCPAGKSIDRWPPVNVTTAGPKPAGNKLRLRAAGIGHDEGGGQVAHGATTRWYQGETSRERRDVSTLRVAERSLIEPARTSTSTRRHSVMQETWTGHG
jgi:hypothetical protein